MDQEIHALVNTEVMLLLKWFLSSIIYIAIIITIIALVIMIVVFILFCFSVLRKYSNGWYSRKGARKSVSWDRS